MFKSKKLVKVEKVNEKINTDVDDKKALAKIRYCFTIIITNFGFFANMLFNLTLIESKKISRLATDGFRILYNPDFVNKLSSSEVTFMLVHEIMHNANLHFLRISKRKPKMWIRAADYAINIMINDMVKELALESDNIIIETPKDIILEEKYRNMSAEEIYKILEQEQKNNKKYKGKTGKKTNDGDDGDNDNSLDYDIYEPGSFSNSDGKVVYEGNAELDNVKNTEDLADIWKNIRNRAAAKNQGTGSISMNRWLTKLNKPKINWKDELRKFVSDIFDQMDVGYFDRRAISRGDYFSTLKNTDTSSYEDVVITIDTSGSISDNTLNKFATELKEIFDNYGIQNCYIIWCDAKISSVQTFEDVDNSFNINKLDPTGGGGTSFIPPFEWVDRNLLSDGRTPAFMIYFTDAKGDFPTINQYDIKSYENRVMWVVTENDDVKIDFGTTLNLDKKIN